MKIIIFLSFIFVQTALSQESLHHVPQFAEDQGPDLPVVGSSMFDKIFSVTKNGESHYVLPFPLSKMMKKIESGKGQNIIHTMLPFSRSLQRPSSTSYDPLLNPRLVFTAKQSKTWLERAKIFIGYVKATDQLEVISYNDEAGRYEYQLVKDYGKNPKVFYVNRGKCLSCHQGQAPIFSVPGWQDTNTGVLGGLIAAKIDLKGASSQLNRKLMAQKLFGNIPSYDLVGNFDAIVRESNEIALDERIWNVGCGSNNKCRLGLLLSTVVPNSESAIKYMKLAKQTINNSILPSQNLYSSFPLRQS